MKKLVNFRLPLFIALSVISGIIFAYSFAIQNRVLTIVCGSVCLILTAFYFLFSFKNRSIVKSICFIFIFVVFFALSSLLTYTQINSFDNASLNNQYYLVEGRVDSVAESNSGIYIVVGNIKLKDASNKRVKHKVGVYVNGSSLDDFEIGNVVSFNALLRDKPLVYENRLAVYDISSSVRYTAFVDGSQIQVIGNSPSIFQRVNLFIKNSLKSGLNEKEFSVAYALLTGNDQFMQDDVITGFRQAGIAHIFAVSGLHIGFLSTVLTFICKKTKLNKWISLVLITAVLIFYSGVCGFSSSSIRATIMCTVALLCFNLWLKYDGVSSLFIACIIVLLISPIELFCVGFQLSFVVVLGIILLSRPIKKLLKFLPNKVASSLAVVISAQLVSIPISLISFGEVSLVAVMFNVAFIPLVGVIYVLTFLLTILGGIFSISNVTLFLLNYVYTAIIWFINCFDYSIFMVGGIAVGFFAIAYYLALVFCSGFFNVKRLTRYIIAGSLGVCFICGCIFLTGYRNNQDKAFVIGSNNLCATLICIDDENVLIVNDANNYSSLTRLIRIKNGYGIERIDKLIVANSVERANLQNLCTKLNVCFDVRAIYYYGEERADEENAIIKSFGNIPMVNFQDGERLPIKNFKCEFRFNGYAVECVALQKRLITFSSMGNKVNLENLGGNYDMVVASDYVERIFAMTNSKIKLSYKGILPFDNAETNGNYILNFN